MRKWMGALFLALALALFASAALSECEIVYVNNPVATDRLHLRSEAKKGSASLGRFYNGTSAQVLSRSNGFVQLRIGTGEGAIEGWMMESFLSDSFVDYATPCARVYTSSANGTVALRTQPDAASATVVTYYDGMYCDILGDINEDWVYVWDEWSDTFGYLPVSQIVRLAPNLPHIYDAPTACIAQPDGGSEPVHLRLQPDSHARSLGRYYPGTQVYVLDESDGWSLVCAQPTFAPASSRYGYIRTRFLQMNTWLDTPACYATLTQDTPVYQKALDGAPQLGKLLAGARVKPYALDGDYVWLALSDEVVGCVPAKALSFSDASVSAPGLRLYGAQGLCIVSDPTAPAAPVSAYATCDAYYPLLRVNASVDSSGFPQGECLVMLADLGEWVQVFDGYDAPFLPASCVKMLKTGDFTSISGVMDAGESVAGEALPAGFYTYHLLTPDRTGLLRIEGDGFTREYEPVSPALYSFYLPEGARLTWDGEGAFLSALDMTHRDSPFSLDYASGRILVGANMNADEFWVMPADDTRESYITITTFEQDISADEPVRIEVLPADENGWPQQHLFAPTGCFIEYHNCIFGTNG